MTTIQFPTDDITRVDLERQGPHVLVQFWRKGWQPGQMTDMCQYVVDTRIENLLHECERAGFSVEMCDSFHGRALRGEITRVDFIVEGNLWTIKKFPTGWTAKTRPLAEYPLDPEKGKSALQWLKDNHWTVREWPNGARAWKGEPKPIRDTRTIQYLRRQVNQSTGDPRRQFDLAFDF